MTNTIPTSALIPTQYEPKRANRFILELDGIDSFLVKMVHLPKWSAKDGEPQVLGPVELYLYDPIAPNGAQQVMAVCAKSSKEPIDFKLKLLGPVGTVVHVWKVGKATVDHVYFGDLDYGNALPIEIKVVFNIKTFELTFQ